MYLASLLRVAGVGWAMYCAISFVIVLTPNYQACLPSHYNNNFYGDVKCCVSRYLFRHVLRFALLLCQNCRFFGKGF